jgi:TDG/mug DNA glycosylase family protein
MGKQPDGAPMVERRPETSLPRRRPPTREELLAARDKTLPDVIAPGLRVLFCGINPGLYTAAIGHHFGRPGNRFWPTLHRAGFTPRLLSPYEARQLLPLGYGITNVVDRATAAADELEPEEYILGGRRLREKLRRYKPAVLAVLGVGAYRTAFERPKAQVGAQDSPLEGSAVWVLPNPSGLNANYQIDRLVEVFTDLRRAAERLSPAGGAAAAQPHP